MLRSLSRVLGVLSLFLFLWTWDVSAQVRQDHWVKMADGTELHTVVLLPGDGQGSWPVVLTRGPYKFDHDFGLLQLGVVKVEQYTRGRFQSKGEDTVFGDDRSDGGDTVAWIRKQPWCNGRVATFGGSALGITQYLMAEAAGDGLSAQMVWVGSSDLYHQTFFSRGGFRQSLVTGWLENQATTNQMPLPHPMLAAFERETLSGTAFWKARSIQEPSKINTPALHVGGWFDFHAQSTLDTFMMYQNQGGALARGKQILIMGPWVHDIGRAQVGELTFPAGAETFAGLSLLDLFTGYVDRYLHQKPTSVLDGLAPVNVYVMGAVGEVGALGNQWVKAQTWPPPVQQELRVYLRSNKSLSIEEPQATDASATFSYDPKHPVSTLGGDNLLLPSGSYDQRSLESRSDVLLYTSVALPSPILVMGRVKAHLWVSTDAADTDFTVKVTDVYPDGRSMLLMDAIGRLRHHKSTTKEDFVTPNTPVALEIDLGSTAMVFNQGHQIRVAISSSNSPRFAPNPNTGAKFAIQPSMTVVAKNTVYHDKQRASYIVLPIPDFEAWQKQTMGEGVQEQAPVEKVEEPVLEDSQEAGPLESAKEESIAETALESSDASVTEVPIQETPTEGNVESTPRGGCGCRGGSSEASWVLFFFVGILLVVRRRGARA
ncbi:MAG: CocE/NonD family hydrolase [Myxococcales bacterium]|nr:CocE/NonD family hydrolase [Myxococcales bacterium]